MCLWSYTLSARFPIPSEGTVSSLSKTYVSE
jgi:hypothetical protein